MPEIFLVDTSAWIEWIRGTDSAADREVQRLVQTSPETVAITEPVTMELLAGAASPRALARLEKLTAGLRTLPFDAAIDFHAAAALFRAMRAAGTPVRSMTDCLIAAVAMRTVTTVLHRDRDFDALAAASGELRTRSLR